LCSHIHVCYEGYDGLFVNFLGLPLGILGWFLYATLLGTRIAIIFKKDVQLES